ncbi:MAG: hypothetical protein WCD76_20375 [Pyrinomonadaceae bacterium]
MKNLRHFCAAFMLTLMFAVSVFAGQIDIPIAPPVTPPASPSSVTTQGQIETGITTNGETPAGSSVTEAALSLLQSVLALF